MPESQIKCAKFERIRGGEFSLSVSFDDGTFLSVREYPHRFRKFLTALKVWAADEHHELEQFLGNLEQ